MKSLLFCLLSAAALPAARGRAATARRAATGMDVVPTFTLGWDPSPRHARHAPRPGVPQGGRAVADDAGT